MNHERKAKRGVLHAINNRYMRVNLIALITNPYVPVASRKIGANLVTSKAKKVGINQRNCFFPMSYTPCPDFTVMLNFTDLLIY
jgi:hypothetical protein